MAKLKTQLDQLTAADWVTLRALKILVAYQRRLRPPYSFLTSYKPTRKEDEYADKEINLITKAVIDSIGSSCFYQAITEINEEYLLACEEDKAS